MISYLPVPSRLSLLAFAAAALITCSPKQLLYSIIYNFTYGSRADRPTESTRPGGMVPPRRRGSAVASRRGPVVYVLLCRLAFAWCSPAVHVRGKAEAPCGTRISSGRVRFGNGYWIRCTHSRGMQQLVAARFVLLVRTRNQKRIARSRMVRPCWAVG
jgi:hypothetical protein